MKQEHDKRNTDTKWSGTAYGSLINDPNLIDVQVKTTKQDPQPETISVTVVREEAPKSS